MWALPEQGGACPALTQQCPQGWCVEERSPKPDLVGLPQRVPEGTWGSGGCGSGLRSEEGGWGCPRAGAGVSALALEPDSRLLLGANDNSRVMPAKFISSRL